MEAQEPRRFFDRQDQRFGTNAWRALVVVALLGLAVGIPAALLAGPSASGSEEKLEKWLSDAPWTTVLALLPKLAATALGIWFLVQEMLRADRIRHAVLPAPDPAGPTVVADVRSALLLGVGFPLLVTALAPILFPPAKGQPVSDTHVLATTVAAFLPPALLTALRRQRLGAGRLPGVGQGLLQGLRFTGIALLLVIPIQVVWAIALKAAGIGAEIQDIVQKFMEPKDPAMPWVIGVFGAVVAPFTEEGIFRGLLYPALRGRVPLGPFGAAVITSLVFAAIHGSVTALLPLFVLALVLCWVMERTNSLLACVVVHALHNTLSLLPLLWRHAMGNVP